MSPSHLQSNGYHHVTSPMPPHSPSPGLQQQQQPKRDASPVSPHHQQQQQQQQQQAMAAAVAAAQHQLRSNLRVVIPGGGGGGGAAQGGQMAARTGNEDVSRLQISKSVEVCTINDAISLSAGQPAFKLLVFRPGLLFDRRSQPEQPPATMEQRGGCRGRFASRRWRWKRWGRRRRRWRQ